MSVIFDWLIGLSFANNNPANASNAIRLANCQHLHAIYPRFRRDESLLAFQRIAIVGTKYKSPKIFRNLLLFYRIPKNNHYK